MTMDDKIFSSTLSTMSKQLKYLKLNGFPGLCQDIADITKSNIFPQWMENGYTTFERYDLVKKYEEVAITLPYAGTNFTVKLYFNLHEPWVSPDMSFSDIRFMKNIKVEDLEEIVPCLNNWNCLADDIIAQLFFQLHQLYKKYQLNCLDGEELLMYEYQSLLKALGIGEEDVEISLSGGSSWMLSLMVRLPVSLKDVPPALIDSNPGPTTCLLHICLKTHNGAITPKLHLSPQVQSLIGDSKALGLPVVAPGSSISDYSSRVLRLLEDRIKFILLDFEMRKQFIAQLLCHFGSALIEYDAEKFSKASFLLDWKNFNFMVIVEIPEDFPKAIPKLTLYSVYHKNSRGPLMREVSSLNYSSNATLEDIVKAIQDTLIDTLPDFQSYTINAKQ